MNITYNDTVFIELDIVFNPDSISAKAVLIIIPTLQMGDK